MNSAVNYGILSFDIILSLNFSGQNNYIIINIVLFVKILTNPTNNNCKPNLTFKYPNKLTQNTIYFLLIINKIQVT